MDIIRRTVLFESTKICTIVNYGMERLYTNHLRTLEESAKLDRDISGLMSSFSV